MAFEAYLVRWPGQEAPSRVSLAYCMPFGWIRSWIGSRWKVKFEELAENGDWLAQYTINKDLERDVYEHSLDRLYDWDIDRTPVERLAHGALFHYHGQSIRAREMWSRSPQHPLSQWCLFETRLWDIDDPDESDDLLFELMNTNPYILFRYSHFDPVNERPGKALSRAQDLCTRAAEVFGFDNVDERIDMIIQAIDEAEKMGDPAVDPDGIIMTMSIKYPFAMGDIKIFRRIQEVSPESDYVQRKLKRLAEASVSGLAGK